MTRSLTWIVLHVLLAFLFYAGCYEGVTGAKNVFLFAVWLNFFVSFALFYDDFGKIAYAKGRSVPKWFSGAYDAAMIASLIWLGMWFTGSACMFSTIAHAALFERGKEKGWPTSEATA